MTVEDYITEHFGTIIKLGSEKGSSFVYVGYAENATRCCFVTPEILASEIVEVYDSIYLRNTKIIIFKGNVSGKFWLKEECDRFMGCSS